MGRQSRKQINLTKFACGTARLSPEYCSMIAAACALKLKQYSHGQPAELAIEGSYNEKIEVCWTDPDPRTARSLGEKATEFAGECIGITLSEKLTKYNVVERSFIGTGFDFWLGQKKDPLFQRKAKLEVSGIDDGPTSEINARVRIKQKQIDRGKAPSGLKAFVVVSQFQRPVAKVIRHA